MRFVNPTSGRPPDFARTVAIATTLLSAALEAWTAGRSDREIVSGRHVLQLREPQGDASAGWTINGRMRGLTSFRSIPVVVQLWPIHRSFARITMTPRRRVTPSGRYFRRGNSVLDRLEADLNETSARSKYLSQPTGPVRGCRLSEA